MREPIYNHNDLCQLLYNGNTLQAIKIFTDKTNSISFTPFLRNSYLSSLNFGIYNYILLKENISLHECCMENERKILKTTNDNLLDIGIDIICSYADDSRYLIEKYTNTHIKSALVYIHQHLSEPLSLQTVSDAICINPSYLSDLFKREVGMTFSDYVASRRIATAKRLLRNPNLQIQDIAEQCGYKSISYFSTCFKKATGHKATDYRRMPQNVPDNF